MEKRPQVAAPSGAVAVTTTSPTTMNHTIIMFFLFFSARVTNFKHQSFSNRRSVCLPEFAQFLVFGSSMFAVCFFVVALRTQNEKTSNRTRHKGNFVQHKDTN